MKKVIAVAVVVCVFALMAGIALAEDGAAQSTGTKSSGPALNNMANWVLSHFPGWEKSAPAKEAAPPLSDEELKIQRENTGMGMRGRIK